MENMYTDTRIYRVKKGSKSWFQSLDFFYTYHGTNTLAQGFAFIIRVTQQMVQNQEEHLILSSGESNLEIKVMLLVLVTDVLRT